MNLLWIEDNEKISDLKKKFFDSCKEFDQNIHNITIPKSFDEAYNEIMKAEKKYDYIILDINLENFDIGKEGKKLQTEYEYELDENKFLKEAGFHLYLRLLPQGFHKERIIFLTGNTRENKISNLLWKFEQAYKNEDAKEIDKIIDNLKLYINEDEYRKIVNLINEGDFEQVHNFWMSLINLYEYSNDLENTYDNFKKHFQKARIDVPFSIHKNNINDFHQWLKGISKINKISSYIFLRRAIIESCSKLIDIVETNEKFDDLILYNKSLFPEFTNISKEEIIYYLTKLKNYFPLNLPKNNNSIFYGFVRELSDLWDKSQGYLYKNDINFNDEIEFNFKNYCQKQMKMLRNWSAHNQLSKNLSEEDVAFFFLIAMRALFDLKPNEIYSYEKNLLTIFAKTNINNKDLERNLAKSYYKLIKKYHIPNSIGSDFHTLINSLGKSKKSNREKLYEESLKLFYQNFFYSISTYQKYSTMSDSKIVVEVYFSLPDLNNNLFVKELSEAIYNKAF